MGFLVTENERTLAMDAVRDVAPAELRLLDDLCTKPSILDRLRRTSVGYGIEPALELFAPYAIVLAVWIKSVVHDEVRKDAEVRLRRLVRRLLGRKAEMVGAPETADTADLRRVTTEYAHQLGLSRERATLLADALVGHLDRGNRG